MTNIIENIDALEESSLSKIWSHNQNHECGAISGYRHYNTPSTNNENNRDIQAFLKSKKYSVTRVQGNYIENKGGSDEGEVVEPSFFVADIQNTGNLKRDLMILGKRFDQDSILIVPKGGEGAYLIGTSKRDNSFPDFGKEQVESLERRRLSICPELGIEPSRLRKFNSQELSMADAAGQF